MRKERFNEHPLGSVKHLGKLGVDWDMVGIARFARVTAAIGAVFAVLIAMPSGPAGATTSKAAAVAIDTRIAGDGTVTRFVADLDRAVPLRAFALADPYRVIVDLPEVSFRLDPQKGQESRGLVTAYRYGLFAPGKSRIVLDVSDPVTIDQAYVNRAEADQPARLVLVLRKTTDAAFRERMKGQAGVTAFPRPNTEAKSSRIRPDAEKPAAKDIHRPVVVIDPGASGVSGLHEKDVVLDFALALRDRLAETNAFEIVMTRDDDTFVPLDDRVRIARENAAALFVSIHADSFRMNSIGGATVYTVSDKASDAEAAALAERENRSDIIAGLHLEEEPDAVTDILLDLVRRETKNLSVQFARELVGDIDDATRLNKNPHRHAGFKVLKAPDVPSVLIELGYISNRDDEKQLADPVWRKSVAGAVAVSIRDYLQPRLAGREQ